MQKNYPRLVRYTLLCSLMLYSATTPAQRPLSFKHFDHEDGLMNDNFNMYIQQDSRGFTWISSIEGFYRFNGLNFKHYNSKDYDLNGEIISSNFIEDKNGDLWFSSYHALHHYSRATDRLQPIQVRDAKGDTVKQDYYLFHYQSRQEKIWLKAGKEIYVLPTTEPFEPERLPIQTQGARFTVDTTADGTVRSIIACPWKNVHGLEVIRLNAKKEWEITHYDNWRFKGGQLSPLITKAISINDSMTWLLTDGAGILKLNEKRTDTIVQLFADRYPDLVALEAFPDDDGKLWLSTRGEGLFLIDMAAEKIRQNWQFAAADPESMASNDVIGMNLGKDQSLWLAYLNRGVGYALPSKRTPASLIPKIKDEFPKVHQIQQDRRQNIWVITEGQGVYRFDGDGNIIDHFESAALPVAPDKILQLAVDDNRRVWCLGQLGVYQFDPSKDQWNSIAKGDSYQFISMLWLHSGSILLNTNLGLRKLNLRENGYELEQIPEFIEYQNFPFHKIFQGSENRLVLPFESREIWMVEALGEQFTVQKKISFDPFIFSLAASAGGDTVWLATAEGLYEIDATAQPRRLFEQAWQIGDQSVFLVKYDQRGSIWLSTSTDLWNYDFTSQQLIKLALPDGIAPEELTAGFALLPHSGDLLLSTPNGVITYSKSDLPTDPPAPTPYIEELLIHNSPYQDSNYIGELDHLHLSYRENSLQFRLTAITNYFPAESSIRYRLLSHHNTWKVLPNGGWAEFDQLQPGHYQLEIIAINHNGFESPPKTLNIKISPPFWQTWWFRLMSLLLLVLLAYGLVRIYVSRKLEAQKIIYEKEHAVLRERTRIADDLHDELGRELSDISAKSYDLLNDHPLGEIEGQLQAINRSANALLEKMEDILWVLDEEHISLKQLLEKIESDTRQYLKGKGIAFDFSMPVEKMPRSVNSMTKSHLLKIFKEAVYNIVKHAQATRAAIRVAASEDGQYMFSISDNGKGFDLYTGRQNRGRGLNNMEKRVSSLGGDFTITSSENQGTELKIIIPIK